MYGGVETFLVTLARHAHLCPGMEVSFGLCFGGRCGDELLAAGARVHFLGKARTREFWTIAQARRRLRRLLREIPFDVVVCHMPWSHAIFAPEVRRAGKPLIFWAHGPAHRGSWLERWASRVTPDLAIANSRFTADTLKNLFTGAPTEIIYYPVSSSNADADALALRRELGASADDVVIVQVSRMEAWKGHRVHLKALARLKSVPGWTCWIVGGAQSPQEREYLNTVREEARELGLADKVSFLGQRRDVAALLSASDIFCQPNEGPEPFGIVFIEALWAGIPVVTAGIGGGAEIVTEGEGCLITPGDAETLARCLLELIQQPDRRRSLGRRGPARAKLLCDAGARIEQVQGALNRVCQRRPSLSSQC